MTAMRCKCRRQAETSLCCARCSVPICPDCSRVASAGMLCRECGSGRHSPLFQVSGGSLALGTGVCLAVGTVGGWLLASVGYRMGFFGGFLAFLDGIVVAEAGLRAVKRKRGLQVEIMAGVSAALGLAGGLAVHLLTQFGGEWQPALTHLYLLNPFAYLAAGIAVYGAVSRVRSL